jgi:hypothetical protein
VISDVFRRSIAGGWLIISGPRPVLDERAIEHLLQVIDPMSGASVLVPGAVVPSSVNGWLEDLEALLEIEIAPVDLEKHSIEELKTLIHKDGLVVLVGESAVGWVDLLRSSLFPIEGVLVLVGSPTVLLGEWAYSFQTKTLEDGLGWMPGCLIIPETEDSEIAHKVLQHEPKSYALELEGSATLALGPAGEINLWGSPAPSIILGYGWGEL